MRLLLTRAAVDSARTQEKLEAMGHAVLLAPVISIQWTNAPWPGGVVDALIATSGHAFIPLKDICEPPSEARRLMPLLLVGSRTKEMARQNGFHGEAFVAANATALAVGIGKLARKPRRIVYLAGRARKPDVETALRVIGQPVEVVEIYEATALDTIEAGTIEAIRAGTLDGVLHYSRRSAALFLELTSANNLDVRRLRHFCLSEDVAAPLQETGCRILTISEAPTEAALLSCCQEAGL